MELMIIPAITLLATLFLYLTIAVIKQRRRHQVAYDVIEVKAFKAAVSAQRNFVDSVPFTLLLIIYLSTQTSSLWVVFVPLIALVIGRYSHAFGLLCLEQRDKPVFKGRAIGMILTFFSLFFTVTALIITLF